MSDAHGCSHDCEHPEPTRGNERHATRKEGKKIDWNRVPDMRVLSPLIDPDTDHTKEGDAFEAAYQEEHKDCPAHTHGKAQHWDAIDTGRKLGIIPQLDPDLLPPVQGEDNGGYSWLAARAAADIMGCPRQTYNPVELKQLIYAGLDNAKSRYKLCFTNPDAVSDEISELATYNPYNVSTIPDSNSISLVPQDILPRSQLRLAWQVRVRQLAGLCSDWQESADLINDLVKDGLSEKQETAYEQVCNNPKLKKCYLRLVRTVAHLGCQYNERLEHLFTAGPGAYLYRREEVKEGSNLYRKVCPDCMCKRSPHPIWRMLSTLWAICVPSLKKLPPGMTLLRLEQLAKQEPDLAKRLLDEPVMQAIGDCSYITDLCYSLDLILPDSMARDIARVALNPDPAPDPEITPRQKKAQARLLPLIRAVMNVRVDNFLIVRDTQQNKLARKEAAVDLWRSRMKAARQPDESGLDWIYIHGWLGQRLSRRFHGLVGEEFRETYDMKALLESLNRVILVKYGREITDVFDNLEEPDDQPQWSGLANSLHLLDLEQLSKKEPDAFKDVVETPIINTIGDCAYIIDLSYCLDLVLPEKLAGDTAQVILQGDPGQKLRYKTAYKRWESLADATAEMHLESGINQDLEDVIDVHIPDSDAATDKGIAREPGHEYDLVAWVAAVDAVLQKQYGRGMADLFDDDKGTEASKPRWTTSKPTKPHREFIELESDHSPLSQSGRAYLISQGLVPPEDNAANGHELAASVSEIEARNRVEEALGGEIEHPLFKVTKKQLKLTSRLLGDDSREDAGQVRWDDIVKMFKKLGFVVSGVGGSIFSSKAPDPADPTFIVHRPHPDSTMGLGRARALGKKLKKFYGWSTDWFFHSQTEESDQKDA